MTARIFLIPEKRAVIDRAYNASNFNFSVLPLRLLNSKDAFRVTVI